jgi:hypothetical protein
VLRGLQILFSFVILAMAGYLIHGHALAANGFAVVCSVFTWIVVSYGLISEKVKSANGGYNIWAILSLDLFMAIFWLASLGANAALRASFKYDVNVEACFNDGSMINSNTCIVSKRALEKRAAVAGEVGLALMSAIAGVSALEWLFFIATLVFHGHTYRLWHQEHKKPSADNATVEEKAQGAPMLAPQAGPQPAQPQYTDQQQYHSQMHPPQPQPQPQAYPQPTPSPSPAPYAQQTAAYPPQQQQQQPQQPYTELSSHQQPPTHHELGAQQQPQQYATFPDPAHHHQQQAYSPHGTPAPGQPYYPPQQQHQPVSPQSTPGPGQGYYPPQ